MIFDIFRRRRHPGKAFIATYRPQLEAEIKRQVKVGSVDEGNGDTFDQLISSWLDSATQQLNSGFERRRTRLDDELADATARRDLLLMRLQDVRTPHAWADANRPGAERAI